jgi:hypothetical protein
MLSTDVDYQRVLAAFQYHQLPNYVSYVQRDAVAGYATDKRVVLRLSDGTIAVGPSTGQKVENPFTNPPFLPQCYHAVSEASDTIDGLPAIRFDLHAICGTTGSAQFTKLYVDRDYFPIAVSGEAMRDHGMAQFKEEFTRYHSFALPSSIIVKLAAGDVNSKASLDIDEKYSSYEFRDSPAE